MLSLIEGDTVYYVTSEQIGLGGPAHKTVQ